MVVIKRIVSLNPGHPGMPLAPPDLFSAARKVSISPRPIAARFKPALPVLISAVPLAVVLRLEAVEHAIKSVDTSAPTPTPAKAIRQWLRLYCDLQLQIAAKELRIAAGKGQAGDASEVRVARLAGSRLSAFNRRIYRKNGNLAGEVDVEMLLDNGQKVLIEVTDSKSGKQKQLKKYACDEAFKGQYDHIVLKAQNADLDRQQPNEECTTDRAFFTSNNILFARSDEDLTALFEQLESIPPARKIDDYSSSISSATLST